MKTFVNKIKQLDKSIKTLKVENGKEAVSDKYLLITYTINKGEMPKMLVDFLKNNAKGCVGVVGSGNKNWGSNFCKGAYMTSTIVGKPVYHTFELKGSVEDVQKVYDIYKTLLE